MSKTNIQGKEKPLTYIYRQVALRRILYLYKKAKEVAKYDLNLANRYIYLLWKLKLKYRITLPKNLRNKFCRKCLTIWIPGKTLRIRVRKGKIVYTCLRCGRIKRFPVKR